MCFMYGVIGRKESFEVSNIDRVEISELRRLFVTLVPMFSEVFSLMYIETQKPMIMMVLLR